MEVARIVTISATSELTSFGQKTEREREEGRRKKEGERERKKVVVLVVIVYWFKCIVGEGRCDTSGQMRGGILIEGEERSRE